VINDQQRQQPSTAEEKKAEVQALKNALAVEKERIEVFLRSLGGVARATFRAASGCETFGRMCTPIARGYTRAQHGMVVAHDSGILSTTFSIRMSMRDREVARERVAPFIYALRSFSSCCGRRQPNSDNNAGYVFLYFFAQVQSFAARS